MAKWYGVTVSKEEADAFKNFLRQEPSVIDFEPSSCYDDIHIEFLSELPFSEIIDKYLEYAKEVI